MENNVRYLVKIFSCDAELDLNALMDCIDWADQNYFKAEYIILSITNKDGTEDSGFLPQLFPQIISNRNKLLTLSILIQNNSKSLSIYFSFDQSIHGPNGNLMVMYDSYKVQTEIAEHIYNALKLEDIDNMKLAIDHTGPMTVKPVFKQWKFDLFKKYMLLLVHESNIHFQQLLSAATTVADRHQFKVVHSNSLYGIEYLDNLWQAINEAKLIIVSVENDPLYYYLLGIIHTIGKKSILVIGDKTDVPFDLLKFNKLVLTDNTSGNNSAIEIIENAIKD